MTTRQGLSEFDDAAFLLQIVVNSGFHRESHAQLAVRDSSCILGWFLLPGESPLSEEAFGAAQVLLGAVSRDYPRAEPRRKVTPDATT
jgi:hypothetical protein